MARSQSPASNMKPCYLVMLEEQFARFLQRPTLSALLRLQGNASMFWRHYGDDK